MGRSVRKGKTPLAKSTMLGLTHKLLSGSGDQIIAEIIRKALDPKDRDQAAMLKICMDRMAPVSAFEKEGGNTRPSIELRVTVASPVDATLVAAPEVNNRAGQALVALSPHLDNEVIDVTPREVPNDAERVTE